MIVLLGLAVALPAGAQVVPPTVDPGRIEKRFQKPPTPKAEPKTRAPVVPPRLTPEKAKAIKFVLKGVKVDGVTVYAPQDFQYLYKHLIGKKVSLYQMFGVATAITARYRNDGYILSTAFVPTQTIRTGVVRIRVVEGYVKKIIYHQEGSIAGPLAQLKAFAEKIALARPLNTATLERYLLLMNDLPGIKVKSSLSPAAIHGASDLTLTLLRQKRIDANASVDNRGTRFLGPIQFSLGGSVNSVLGFFEQTGLNVVMTQQFRELQYGSGFQEWVIGSEGLKFRMDANYSKSNPGFTLGALEFKSRSISASGTLSYPLIRSRHQNLSLFGGFKYQNSKTNIIKALFTEDRLRILHAGWNYDIADKWRGVNLFRGQFSQGINVLDATETGTPSLSRVGGKSNFTKFDGLVSRTQTVTDQVSLLMQASGQYAFDELLSSVEFGFGGAQFGRAFDSSEITADHGVAMSVELSYADRPPATKFLRLLKGYQIYTFYDWGRVWRKKLRGRLPYLTASSAGVGFRLSMVQQVGISLEAAKPLRHAVSSLGTKGRAWRFFFNAGIRY